MAAIQSADPDGNGKIEELFVGMGSEILGRYLSKRHATSRDLSG